MGGTLKSYGARVLQFFEGAAVLALWEQIWTSSGDAVIVGGLCILAIVIAALGTWTTNGWSTRTRWGVFALAAVVTIAEGGFVYWHIHPQTEATVAPATPAPPSKSFGAKFEITAVDPEKLADGSYYLPVDFHNTGDQDVNGYVFILKQQQFPARLTVQQELQFMGAVESAVRKEKITPAKIVSAGVSLARGDGRVMRVPRQKLSEEQMQQIRDGKLFPYYGVMIVYSDDSAHDQNILWVTEYCEYFDANEGQNMLCGGPFNYVRQVYR